MRSASMSDLNIIDKSTVPICCHLRSKGMYIHGTTDVVDTGMPGTGDGHFWCLKTMHLFGPDNEVVNRQECKPGRHCYETV
jgi:hypothetical protein